MEKFDEKTKRELESYVYALVDPRTNTPFYIGKGEGNRIFNHVYDADTSELDSQKLKQIQNIKTEGQNVQHVILRHGMTSEEAYLVEASLIDFFNMFVGQLSNEVSGHETDLFGAMSVEEIKRRYGARPLDHIGSDCVLININRRYDRTKGSQAIYEATRQKWVMSSSRIGDPKNPKLKVVISEFRGVVVEVFTVDYWYRVLDENGKNRWGFEGRVADNKIRDKYINRLIAKRRYGNPIMYGLK